MPSLFHSTEKFYLSFPNEQTVLFSTKSKGEGDHLFEALSRGEAVTLVKRVGEAQPHYEVIEEQVDKHHHKYFIKSAQPINVGDARVENFTSELDTKGLFKGKHYFKGPDGQEYKWEGKGKEMELKAGDDTEIAEWEPKDRLLTLKPARLGKHKNLDTEFIVATFVAILAYQDDINKVDPENRMGRARGRPWSERIDALEESGKKFYEEHK